VRLRAFVGVAERSNEGVREWDADSGLVDVRDGEELVDRDLLEVGLGLIVHVVLACDESLFEIDASDDVDSDTSTVRLDENVLVKGTVAEGSTLSEGLRPLEGDHVPE